jgi:hypothetical protein
LSHIGLKLERMLAFIYTKNKVIRDEEIHEGDIFERLPDNTGRVTRPPEWLGLNPNRVDIDWDDGKFEENPKNGKFLGSNWGPLDFIEEYLCDSTVLDFDRMRQEIKDAEMELELAALAGDHEKKKKK